MNTSDAIDILRKFKVNFADKYGIKTLGLFGWFARKQQKETSDLDVVVILEEPDFFTLVVIKEELEKLINYKVDVVNFRELFRESFKTNILKDAIFVWRKRYWMFVYNYREIEFSNRTKWKNNFVSWFLEFIY